jgi:hypothetical protein
MEDTTMLLHEHRSEVFAAGPQGSVAGGPSGHGLDRVREAGESLLHAADQAIQRALSGDSLAFLEATRQDGGQ